jgi:hypothetical protein
MAGRTIRNGSAEASTAWCRRAGRVRSTVRIARRRIARHVPRLRASEPRELAASRWNTRRVPGRCGVPACSGRGASGGDRGRQAERRWCSGGVPVGPLRGRRGDLSTRSGVRAHQRCT